MLSPQETPTTNEEWDPIPTIEQSLTVLVLMVQGFAPETKVGKNLLDDVRRNFAESQGQDARMEAMFQRIEALLRHYPHENED
jgi:hypothetical protein